MTQKINICVIFRVLFGVFFIVSGAGKVIEPYQNFLHVVQSYELFPVLIEETVARIIPLVELILGAFLLLGLWLPWTVRGLMVLVMGFIIVVGQALLRGLPVTECGCFGEMISFPLHVVILIDTVLLLSLGFLSCKMHLAQRLSLDGYFATAP